MDSPRMQKQIATIASKVSERVRAHTNVPLTLDQYVLVHEIIRAVVVELCYTNSVARERYL